LVGITGEKKMERGRGREGREIEERRENMRKTSSDLSA